MYRLQTGVSGNVCSFLKEVNPLVVHAVEHGIAMELMKGKWASSRVDLGYTELFSIPDVTSVFISSCDGVLGTLWCSIKKIEASYMFDWEYRIALHAMQGIRASSPSEGHVSWDFSRCSRNLGYILELQRGWPFETPLCSAQSGLLSSYDKHLRNAK